MGGIDPDFTLCSPVGGRRRARTAALPAPSAYAKSIGLGSEYVQFRQTELNIKTGAMCQNGQIPFNVQYKDLSPEMPKMVIELRENYQRTAMIFCLANAKKLLNDAK